MDEMKCCSVMFKLWCERQRPQATWRQLIDALYEVQLNRIASDVESLLRPAEEQEQIPTIQTDGKS